MKQTNRITAVLTLAFIAAVLIATVVTGAIRGNRAYANKANAAPGEVLGSIMTDSFAGREQWLRLNALIRSKAGEGLVNGVYVGKGMLLDAESSERKIPAATAELINSFVSRYDGAVYFAVIPTSSGVYSDMLPQYLLKYPENQQINRFYDQLGGSIRKIDAFNILKMLNDSYIFYRTDTKWTCYGAYCVYRTVIQKLGFIPTAYDKYTIRHITGDFKGSLCLRSRYSNVKPDIIDVYVNPEGAEVLSCRGYYNDGSSVEKQLIDERLLDTGYMYDIYLGEEAPLVKINTSVNNERKLLVIKDSIADCFIPFLIEHYSEIDVISPELIDRPIEELTDTDNYEQILFLFSIESLEDSSKFRCLAGQKG